MYKKLLSLKRRSTAPTDEISTRPSTSYKQLSTEPEAETAMNCNCCELCCPQALCQLCTASLILPSCVGAIRALQAMAEHKCCTSGSHWMLPATDAMTISNVNVTGNSHCCTCCC
ncbi:hypothetical protein KR093_011068 [Drosophila rubida]|uniref:Uncharacterized protein n=1 Tax=Drosophila rubida TaxID=30044 RepID=A0AAD4PID8_9MUSC|nr:hypothetical protein KR093_011068 [Drosophila rubida]